MRIYGKLEDFFGAIFRDAYFEDPKNHWQLKMRDFFSYDVTHCTSTLQKPNLTFNWISSQLKKPRLSLMWPRTSSHLLGWTHPWPMRPAAATSGKDWSPMRQLSTRPRNTWCTWFVCCAPSSCCGAFWEMTAVVVTIGWCVSGCNHNA